MDVNLQEAKRLSGSTRIGIYEIDLNEFALNPTPIEKKWRFEINEYPICYETLFIMTLRFFDPDDPTCTRYVEIPPNVVLLDEYGYCMRPERGNTCFIFEPDFSNGSCFGVCYIGNESDDVAILCKFQFGREGELDDVASNEFKNMATISKNTHFKKKKPRRTIYGDIRIRKKDIDSVFNETRVMPIMYGYDCQPWFESMDTMLKLKEETALLLKTKEPILLKFCRTCSKMERGMKMCGKCSKTHYCSVECQKEDYPRHRPTCNTTSK